MKKLYCLPILLVLFSVALSAYGQRGNIWYFGRKAGLDFNFTPPKPLTDGMLNTLEGCASISDVFGKLQFYTDGSTVWNKNHAVMSNGTGLLGNSSATQSGIILPWPGNDSLYYVFTVGEAFSGTYNTFGYNYSVINLNANGGLGAVIVKNKPLYKPSTEKISIAKHVNGVDWWVITKEFGTNIFRSYQVSDTGINLTPVVSAIGYVHSGSAVTTTGAMRSSPDGKKLALAMCSFNADNTNSRTELFDFDIATGKISNGIRISGTLPYGVEFSPDSKLLYVSYGSYSSAPIARIDQFDATLTDSAQIIGSKKTITPTAATYRQPAGMQIGPDGKIYVVKNDNTTLDVIVNPNRVGSACDYTTNAISLSGRQSGMMPPNIISSFLVPVESAIDVNVVNICKRSVTLDCNINYADSTSFKWYFGYGDTSASANPVIIDSSFIKNPSYTFPIVADTFFVRVKTVTRVPLSGGGVDTVTKISTKLVPFDGIIKPGFFAVDTCGSLLVSYRDTSTISSGLFLNKTWEFSDGTTLNNYTNFTKIFPAYATYTAKLHLYTEHGCSDSIEKNILIRARPSAKFNLPYNCVKDYSYFNDGSAIDVSSVINKWNWNFGDVVAGGKDTSSKQNTGYQYSTPGVYNVRLIVESNYACADTLTQKFTINGGQPEAGFVAPVSICSSDSLRIINKSHVDFGAIEYLSVNWHAVDSVIESSSVTDKQYAYKFPEFATPAFSTVQVTMRISSGIVCTAEKTVTVQLNAQPRVAMNDLPDLCGNDKIFVLTPMAGVTNGAVVANSIFYGRAVGTNTGTGKHEFNPRLAPQQTNVPVTFKVSTALGCADSVTKTFKILPVPFVSAGKTKTVLEGVGGSMEATTAGNGLQHQWTPANLLDLPNTVRPYAMPSDNTLFTLNVTNAEGCSNIDSVLFKVLKYVNIPNAFSPNGDGINDTWDIKHLFQYPNPWVDVFDRTGQVIYSIRNKNYTPWDGTFNGKPMPIGTYYYLVRPGFGRPQYSGWVAIIR